MMVHDRSEDASDGRFPSAETLRVVRSALARYLAGPAEEREVCDALAVLAREAQDRHLRAEDMLVAFKTLWADMAEVRAMRNPEERRRLLSRVVELCIDAYYQR